MEIIGLGLGIVFLICFVLVLFGDYAGCDTEALSDGIFIFAVITTVTIIVVIAIVVYFRRHPLVAQERKREYFNSIEKQIDLNKEYSDFKKLNGKKSRDELLEKLPIFETLKQSFFYGYYSEFYKTQEGLVSLYTLAYCPRNNIKHPCNEAMILGFDSMREVDDKLLRQYPWLIKIFPEDVCKRRNDQKFINKYK